MQIGTLEYLISINNSNVDSDLKKADSKVKGWGDKLSAWTVAKGQMMGNLAEKAVSAVASAVKNTFKAAISSYADYEQLVGGIDTLFKDSSAKVQQYAAKAYQTVGVSANQYMETVTSFSASLLQSLGGDTDKAADIADMAMKDMSDNVNKMGSSMESVEAAYKGFAKQNYTMLDNLKLGYGGTASEMERLLKDATKLTGKKYNIKNLSDIYEAIHAIQEEYGITGTTQKEALTTITGSLNATKAAWQDVLVAMASGKGVKKAISNFANSAKTTIKNLKPVVMETVKGLGTAAKELFPEIVSIAKDVVSYLYQGISNWFNKNIWQPIVDHFNEAWGTISQLWELAQSNISKTWFAIASWFETYVWKPLAEFFTNAWDTIKQLWEGTQQAISSAWASIANWFDTTVWKPLVSFFTSAWDTISKLWNGTMELISRAWSGIANWFKNTVWEPIASFFEDPWGKITQLWDGVRESISQAWSGIANWFDTTVWKPISDFFDSLWEKVSKLWTGTREAISGAWSGIANWFNSTVWEPLSEKFIAAWDVIKGLWEGTKELISNAWNGIANWFDTTVWTPISEKFTSIWETIQKLWTGISEAISGAWNHIANWFNNTVWTPVKDFFDTAWNAIKEFWNNPLGTIIHAWDEVARWVDENVTSKIKGFFDNVKTAIGEAIDKVGEIIQKLADIPREIIISIKEAVQTVTKSGGDAIIDSVSNATGASEAQKNAWQAGWDFISGQIFHNAKGNWNVPYDNYPSLLHRGEMVLTKSQARQYRNGGSNDYEAIGSIVATAVSAAMNKVNVLMSGEKVGDLTTKRVKNNINSSSYSRLRAFGG